MVVVLEAAKAETVLMAKTLVAAAVEASCRKMCSKNKAATDNSGNIESM